MILPVRIPVGINTPNCLAWSHDGELAIAAGEEVYLLLPKRGSIECFTHLRLKVNEFGREEWGPQDQASFQDMAIGEEQSKVTVTALEWSPPGLAKHRRSVLAVLTSNLVLSIWTSQSDIYDPETWERIEIVNQKLAQINRKDTMARKRQRIRSMAWVPTCHESHHARCDTPFSLKRWGNFLLAATDDYQGIYLFRISSPYLGPGSSWEVDLAYMSKLKPKSSSELPSEGLHGLSLGEQSSTANPTSAVENYDHDQASNMDVSYDKALGPGNPTPVVETGNNSVPNSSSIVEDSVSPVKRRKLNPPGFEGSSSQVATKEQKSNTARPMRFSLLDAALSSGHWFGQILSITCTAAGHAIASPARADVKSLETSPEEKLAPEILSIALSQPLCTEVKVTWVQNVKQGGRDALQIRKALSKSTRAPFIHSEMQQQKEKYSRENSLGGDVVLKEWGCTFFNDFTAVCITLHPSKQIQYTGSVDDFAVIIFDGENSEGPSIGHFPWKRILRIDHSGTIRKIIDSILDPQVLTSPDLHLSTLDYKIIYGAVCARMVLTPSKSLEIWHPVVALLKFLENKTNCDLREEIKMVETLKTLKADTFDDRPERGKSQVELVREMTKKRCQTERNSNPPSVHLVDDCPACKEAFGSQTILFSIDGAFCERRHGFARCPITFLPITQPGLSKQCESCERHDYINEFLHPEIDQGNMEAVPQFRFGPSFLPDVPPTEGESAATTANASKTTTTLASYLFNKFDVCPYCGGKFLDTQSSAGF